MLPTRPRLAARSTSSSCTIPEATTATRVSCGLTLTRTSSMHLFQQLRGLVERQAHHAGIAAAQLDDEPPGASLDAVRARLVVALAALDVGGDLGRGQLLEPHFGARHHAFHPVVALQRDPPPPPPPPPPP